MPHRTIPLVDQRSLPAAAAAAPASNWLPGMQPLDRLARPLTDLRISVTDRCNFRCSYCMPKEVFGPDYDYLPRSALLTFEEITRVAGAAVALGARKLRLTGGEPLLRKGIADLIAQLRPLGAELTLTTNGALLAKKAQALRDAGLHRVTVSLDGLDDAVFRRMNDADFPVADVLHGIDAAQAAGLPVKVNMVVQRGVNEDQILPMAAHFRGSGVVLRFIEFMDVGATNGWRMDQVVPADEVLRRIGDRWPLRPLDGRTHDTAERFAYADGAGEVGTIASVTRAFCRGCSRARLSTDGRIYTCLFASQGHDLRALLRGGAPDAALRAALAGIWSQRSDRYSELRGAPDSATGPARDRIEMSYIGG